MRYRTDDPIADAARYDADCERELRKRPKCVYCRRHIQDDFLFDIDGVLSCEDCTKERFRKPVEDYIE